MESLARWLLLLLVTLGGVAACGGATSSVVGSEALANTPEPRARPGDRIALKVFQEEEMSDTFTIGQNGRVVLPRLGPVHVTEQNLLQLQDSLRTAFAEYLRNPAVEVTVLRRIGVHGEVGEPGLYMVDLTMTLRDLLAKAGGITPTGDPRKITIVRDGQQIRFSRSEQANFVGAELRSGDQVVVGQRPWLERNSLAFASTAAVVVSLLVPMIRGLF